MAGETGLVAVVAGLAFCMAAMALLMYLLQGDALRVREDQIEECKVMEAAWQDERRRGIVDRDACIAQTYHGRRQQILSGPSARRRFKNPQRAGLQEAAGRGLLLVGARIGGFTRHYFDKWMRFLLRRLRGRDRGSVFRDAKAQHQAVIMQPGYHRHLGPPSATVAAAPMQTQEYASFVAAPAPFTAPPEWQAAPLPARRRHPLVPALAGRVREVSPTRVAPPPSAYGPY
eukprot:TRINITY_DN16643_c0_g1_i1.p1 TRINITY_DN16643_c0_g1~~TRINITY_DN16643_c0_g1_i1.p1  ORF type:complete len:230 (+),score=43.12 TRINITY_DN16643_c0_g1_i1:66-755(+)